MPGVQICSTKDLTTPEGARLLCHALRPTMNIFWLASGDRTNGPGYMSSGYLSRRCYDMQKVHRLIDNRAAGARLDEARINQGAKSALLREQEEDGGGAPGARVFSALETTAQLACVFS